MATQVTPARKIIYVPGAQFRSAVSEELIQLISGNSNFIALYQHSEKRFDLNGNYGLAAMPFLSADGYGFFEFNAEIFDVWMYLQYSGSGTTELDIKHATTPGGAFTSIFGTTPKIASTAGNSQWTHIGGAAGTGITVPVFTGSVSTFTVNAGDAIRCDIIQAQTGTTVNGAGLVVHYRPI